MTIWKREVDLTILNEMSKGSLVEALGIEYTKVGEDYLQATMPVDHRTMQPKKILHGGASCSLAESVGSVAANCCLDQHLFYAVGLEINTSHLKMAHSGLLTATAKPIKLGKQVHVWEILIENEKKEKISITRLTLSIQEHR